MLLLYRLRQEEWEKVRKPEDPRGKGFLLWVLECVLLITDTFL